MGKILWSGSKRKRLVGPIVNFDLKEQLLSCSIAFWVTLNENVSVFKIFFQLCSENDRPHL